MFRFSERQSRRRTSLTPMIDVVFLLLIFFMLAARFGLDQMLPIAFAGSESRTYVGPPRLLEVAPAGLALNGRQIPEQEVAKQLRALTNDLDDLIAVRPVDGVDLQRLVDAMDLLRDAGFTGLAIVE